MKRTNSKSNRLTKAQRQEAKMLKERAAEHEKLAFSIAGIVAQDRRIEWEIVRNYCEREGKILTSRDKSQE